MRRPPPSYRYVLSVPYVAALSSISGASVWGLHFTGFIWSSVLVVGVLMIVQHRKQIPFPWKLWCPWFGYVLLSLTWGGIHWRWNLQDPAQMLCPLVVGMVASYAIRTEIQLERLMRGFMHCLMFVAAAFAFFWYGPGIPYQAAGSGYSVRTGAMTAAFIGCLFVGRARRNPFRSSLGWMACLAIAFLSGSRMATLAILILWLVTPLYRSLISRILACALMCLAGSALFYSPIFQERFFPSAGRGSFNQVIQGDYSSSGRFDVWPVVWQEAQKHIVFGAGAGEVARFIPKADLFNPEPTPLNDYLQVVFEYGVVGLLILIGTVLRQMHVLHKLIRTRDPAVVWALAAAYLGFFAFLIFAWTENALIYGVYFMNPLFAVTGAAIGLNVNKNLQWNRRYVVRRPAFVVSNDPQKNVPWRPSTGRAARPFMANE